MISKRDELLFEHIAEDISKQGFSICEKALPAVIAESLFKHQLAFNEQDYSSAGIGRQKDYEKNESVRTDQISWINNEFDAGKQWLDWAGSLQSYLNRRLYLGLFSFESHFAHYAPGDYYRRHLDAFQGETNRVLSLVVYLNPEWSKTDGGELVLYHNEADQEGVRVLPAMGTAVIFLSEVFPHEVLPATKDRYSIAGWFRVNTSQNGRIDPPE